MSKWKIILCLVLFLAPSMSWAQESFEDDAWVIDLPTGSYGAGLQDADLNLPESFSAQIDSVNTGRYDLVIEVTNDPTLWKLLNALSRSGQLLKLDEYKIDWDVLQKSADGALNIARRTTIHRVLERLGLKSKRIFVQSKRAEKVYIKVYAIQVPWAAPVQENKRRISHLEHDYGVMSGEVQNLKISVSSQESKFALATMVGATTTRHMICPEASAALLYKDMAMLRGYGFHGLFWEDDQEIYGATESIYDKGWGLGFGFSPYFLGPLWLYGGVHAQSSSLSTSDLAGDKTSWFRGGEFGLILVTDRVVLSATRLYGETRDYDTVMDHEADWRFSINLGNTWR